MSQIIKQVEAKQPRIRFTTFVDNKVGVAESFNSRTSRRMETHGELFAMERELPEVFDLMLGISQGNGWHPLHQEMLETLYAELEQKVQAGVRLSAKTKELYHNLGRKHASH